MVHRHVPFSSAAHRVGASFPNGARVLAALFVWGLIVLSPGSAAADKVSTKSGQGVMFAQWNNCEKAVPLLEEAELIQHQAHAALALADCYAKSGKLIVAVEIYRAVSEEKITKRTPPKDRFAINSASGKLKEAEARIPTIAFEVPKPYEELQVFIDGKEVADPSTPRRVAPDQVVFFIARAKGYQELRDKVTLAEGESLVRPLKLKKTGEKPVARKPNRKNIVPPSATGGGNWIGMRGRGYVIPSFAWRVLGDGGRTVLAPGVSLTVTSDSSNTNAMLSLGYANYSFKATPFKGRNAPDTDWEIMESDMHSVYATAELAWKVRMDDARNWEFFYGGGVGVGWMFAGNLTRTQSYPENLQPGDPYTYKKCNGPNDPPEAILYCNQLKHDGDHYNLNEPSWFVGGIMPLIYPWLAVPQVGITWYPSDAAALDLEVGITTSGLLLGFGLRGR